MTAEQGQLFDPPAKMQSIPAAPGGPVEPAKYFIVLVPEVGDVNVLAFKRVAEFGQALYEWKQRRTAQQYAGDILTFHGYQLEHTQFVGAMRIRFPDGQQLTMQDTSKFEYEGLEYQVEPE